MRRTLGTALLLATASAALAQAPVGPEFRVNTFTTGSQAVPSVAVDADGDFVVVWLNLGSAPPTVAGQRFDAGGGRRGSEFTVNDVPSGELRGTAVAGDGSGAFVVVWTTAAIAYGETDVRGRRYDANGVPRGPSFPVNTFTTATQAESVIAAAADGSFVVVWNSDLVDGSASGIVGQRFDAGGSRLGGEFIVNSSTTDHQVSPDVAMDAAGNFVIVWRDLGPVATAIAGQRFDASGARIGSEFMVNAPPARLSRNNPHVAVAPSGAFVVAWVENDGVSPVLARRFDASGTPQGGNFVVAPFNAYWGIPRFLGGGRFVIAWHQQSSDGSTSVIEARGFEGDGTPRGPVFRVNASTLGRQGFLALGSDSEGRLRATWETVLDRGMIVLDILAQRHGLLQARALAVDTVAGPLSNGNGVLDPGEQVDVRPSWANNAAGAQSLGGALTAFSGPPGAIYILVDGGASYGSVPAGGTQGCLDCYAVIVTPPSARPSLHWDAMATEVINPGGDDGHFDWTLHVGDSFGDVARGNPFYRFVETLLHRGITAGCGGDSYCPGSSTTRGQMAPFLLVAKAGAGFLPPVCVAPSLFADVPPENPFCRFIEELARRGVTTGCGGDNYCPNDAVTRDQMAVFVLRTLDPALDPPACGTPMFGDVPASSPFCRWVEELARRGISTGCGGGNYCPTQPVTREQMAVFLTATFGLTLYGP